MSVRPGEQVTVMYDYGAISGPSNNFHPLRAVVQRKGDQACFTIWFHARLDDSEPYSDQQPFSLFVDREGVDWCRGWDNDASRALLAARVLGAE